jgi:hypothetical protein
MDDSGECLIKVADRALTFWQFRKLALEDLFSIHPATRRNRANVGYEFQIRTLPERCMTLATAEGCGG